MQKNGTPTESERNNRYIKAGLGWASDYHDHSGRKFKNGHYYINNSSNLLSNGLLDLSAGDKIKMECANIYATHHITMRNSTYMQKMELIFNQRIKLLLRMQILMGRNISK